MRKCVSQEERDTRLCEAILCLERYILLILVNAYLTMEKGTQWNRPFSVWMKQVRFATLDSSRAVIRFFGTGIWM